MNINSDKNNESFTNHQDKIISIAILSSFFILMLQYFILISFKLSSTSIGGSVQLISKGLVGIAFLIALPVVLSRSLKKFILVYLIAILLFLINYVIFFDNRIYLNESFFSIFFICLPSFVYSLSIKNLLIFKYIMKKLSYIIFGIGFILGVLLLSGSVSINIYSMALSYYMLLPTIVFMDNLYEKFSWINFVFMIISILIILAYGSRGAILCLLVFFVIHLIKDKKKLTYKRIFAKFILIGSVLIFLISMNKFLESLYLYLQKFGINSRTLMLLSKEELYFSGRENLYTKVLAEFVKKPILGLGLEGDKVILNGMYSHNFFVEILSHFGFIIGTILIILIVLLMIRAINTKSNINYRIIVMWICIGFIPLFISGSYLTDFKFWIVIGLLINPNLFIVYKNKYY